ncbi:MAG: hypothetical protein L3J35_06220 [Bacteroidales bacterium]|nr:hypothetical protein [Bacteroidales bacterium]
MMNVNKLIKPIITILLTGMITFQQSNAQTNSFYVYFKQNNKRINIENAKIELKKQPFTIFVEYTQPLDLFVNASYKSNTYNQAKVGKLMFFIPAFSETNNLETFFRNKGTINLYNEKATIWEKGKTDAEEIQKTDAGRFLAYRNIEKIYSPEHKNFKNIKDVQFDLNMVFIYAEKDEDGGFQEIQREFVKIKWTKNYDEETKNYERQIAKKEKIKKAQALRDLKNKQKSEKKEEIRLKKIEDKKKKGEEKRKKKNEKKEK